MFSLKKDVSIVRDFRLFVPTECALESNIRPLDFECLLLLLLTDLPLVTDDAEFMCGLLVLRSHDRQTYSLFNAADLRYSRSASRARSRLVV